MKVLSIKPYPSEKNPDAGYVTVAEVVEVTSVDGKREWIPGETFDCWTPKVTVLKVGEDVPQGWTRKDSDRGPRLLPPSERSSGGGQSAWRNTEQGARFEQDQMNRRTALMQAVGTIRVPTGTGTVLELASEFLQWLEQPRSSGTSDMGTSVPESAEEGRDGVRTSGEGESSVPVADLPSLETWSLAAEIGLSAAKALVMARKQGWDAVLAADDLTEEQLMFLIDLRRKELS